MDLEVISVPLCCINNICFVGYRQLDNESANRPVSKILESPTSATVDEQSHLLDDSGTPSALLDKKKVYVIHCEDSKPWVDGRLKEVLTAVNVKMVTIEDAVAGFTIANARCNLVNTADKVIAVISPSLQNKLSKEGQWSEFELAHATQKDPGFSKVWIIPVLYGNVNNQELPPSVSALVPLRYDDSNFKEKIKESIDS